MAPFFKPWIGVNYGSVGMFGLPVLIIGEAHYQWDRDIEPYPTLTIEAVKEQRDGEWTKAFWTNIAIAFLGHGPSAEEKRVFGDSVAFYNYIQQSVGFGPRVRPTKKMWQDSAGPLSDVLMELKPQFALVLGHQLWDNLPPLGGTHGPTVQGADRPETWSYPLGNGNGCLAFAVRHPSSGFSGTKFNPLVRKAMSLS